MREERRQSRRHNQITAEIMLSWQNHAHDLVRDTLDPFNVAVEVLRQDIEALSGDIAKEDGAKSEASAKLTAIIEECSHLLDRK